MRRLLIIAHRGASAVAPESTRAAIRAAVHAGAQMVELDIQMTRDRRLVVFHDDQLDRTTNGTGRLSRSRYTQLARLDAGTWFHPRFASERILLLSQAIHLVPWRVRMNLELKRTSRRGVLLDRFLRVLGRAGASKRFLVSSFDTALLRPLHSLSLALALICRHHPERSLQQATRLGCVAWHPFHALITRRRVEQAHRANLRVHAWTVDEPRRAQQLAKWGVDGIFTNHPAHMISRLGGRGT